MVSDTQDKLIQATERLLRTHGLARVTTRDIAREAGVAEGSLYHYFRDKAELILAVVEYGIGDFRKVLEDLPLRVGQRTVRANLERVAYAAFDFHYRIAPMICSVFGDRELLVRYREALSERCSGPQCLHDALASYLQAEQRLGRVAREAVPQAAARLLLASSFHAAMLDQFLGTELSQGAARRRLRDSVQTFMLGLEPRESTDSTAE